MKASKPPGAKIATYHAPRFMSRFSCIGAACEDNCCHGWAVSMDQPRLAQIRRTLKQSPAELARFNEGIELMPPTARRRDYFARFKMLPDGTCPMLDEERLCSLQARNGEAALPEICVSYPRQLFEGRGHQDLTATVSCPEIARLLLLAPDAMEPMELDPALVRNAPPALDTNPSLKEGPFRAFERLRRRMFEILGHEPIPVASRLYCMLELSNQLQQLTPDPARFEAVLQAFADPEVLAELHERFMELRPSLQPSLMPLVLTAGWCRAQAPTEVFAQLSLSILRSYDPGKDLTDGWIDIELLTEAYRRRRQVVGAAFGARIAQYMKNSAQHLWFDHFPLSEGDVAHYVRAVMLRLTLLRFLLISHPEAAAAAEDAAGGQATLDRLAVQLFYSYSRMVDSNLQRRREYRTLVAKQVPTLDVAIQLLAV